MKRSNRIPMFIGLLGLLFSPKFGQAFPDTAIWESHRLYFDPSTQTDVISDHGFYTLGYERPIDINSTLIFTAGYNQLNSTGIYIREVSTYSFGLGYRYFTNPFYSEAKERVRKGRYHFTALSFYFIEQSGRIKDEDSYGHENRYNTNSGFVLSGRFGYLRHWTKHIYTDFNYQLSIASVTKTQQTDRFTLINGKMEYEGSSKTKDTSVFPTGHLNLCFGISF